jgi:hypothetical protein
MKAVQARCPRVALAVCAGTQAWCKSLPRGQLAMPRSARAARGTWVRRPPAAAASTRAKRQEPEFDEVLWQLPCLLRDGFDPARQEHLAQPAPRIADAATAGDLEAEGDHLVAGNGHQADGLGAEFGREVAPRSVAWVGGEWMPSRCCR